MAPSILDDVAAASGAGASASGLTPAEASVLGSALVDDLRKFEEAEQLAKKHDLRLGEKLWRCDGCHLAWKGERGSYGFKTYQSHVKRHAHARMRVGSSETA